jgi:uncharacterized membrane protein YfcA
LGALRQDAYGNVRRADALIMGTLSIAGVAGGVAFANALSAKALRDAFAALMILIAAQLVRRALREPAAATTADKPVSGGGGNGLDWERDGTR